MPYKNPGERKKYNYEYYLCQKAKDYEGIKQRNRASYQRNREKVLTRTSCYYRQNKERHAGWMRAWWQRNRGRLRQYRHKMFQKWAGANPNKVAIRRLRYNALKKSLPATLTTKQMEYLRIIGQAIYPGEELHLDHVVSLSKGGGTTLANTHYIPGWLNILKGDKLPEEIYKQEALL